jgi:hypothetical protein
MRAVATGLRGRRGTTWAVGAFLAAALALPAGARAASISAQDISSLQTVAAAACTSASTCYAVGTDASTGNPAVVTITNGTPSATPADFADTNFEPDGIACPNASQCVVVGDDTDQTTGNAVGAVATVTNGSPGATQEVSSASQLYSIGCASYGYCIVAGQDQSGGYGTVAVSSGTPSASGVSDFSDQNFEPAAVACPSGNTCLVAGQDGTSGDGAVSVVTGGVPASGVQDASQTAELTAIACWSSSGCTAGGAANGGTDDDGDPITIPSVTALSSGGVAGSTWTYSADQYGGMEAAACTPGSTCVAIGDDDNGDDFAAPISNGKAGAQEVLTPDASIGPLDFDSLSCPSASTCIAVGQDESEDPVVAEIPVPAYQSQAPATGNGGGGGSSGSSGSHKRTATRLLIGVSWTAARPIRHLKVTVRCESAVTKGGIDGLRVRLEDRRAGARTWHVVGSALTRRVGRDRGEARLSVAAPRTGVRTQYRAVLTKTSTYGGSTSTTKTVLLGSGA